MQSNTCHLQGPDWGIFGVRITAGGSGGTVAILGDANSRDATDVIISAYQKESRNRPYLFAVEILR